MIELAEQLRLPIVLFAEGGGGRPGRHRPVRALPPRRADLPQLRPPQRPGAADRDRLRTLLRRQRGAARLLRRDHRDARGVDRDGRPGDDRGRRARRLRARGGRAGRDAGAERRDRRARRRRAPTRRRRGAGSSSPTSRARAGDWAAPTSARCATSSPRTRKRVHDVRRRARAARRHGLACSSCAPGLRAHDAHRAGADRGPAGRRDRQRPQPPLRARSTPTAPTRRRASSSSATPSACRSSRWSTRPGSWSGPESERTGDGAATARACSSPASTASVPVPQRRRPRAPSASVPRRWRAATSTRRPSTSPGRPASSAPWASRARSSSRCARSSPQIADEAAREQRIKELVAAVRGQSSGAQHGGPFRDRRRDRPGRDPGADLADPARPPGAGSSARSPARRLSTPGRNAGWKVESSIGA